MIKGLNESRRLENLISCDSRCEFDGKKCNSRQKWNNDKCQWEGKKPVKRRPFEENYSWNPIACACECDKEFEISEYLKDCKFMKSLKIK